MSGTREVFLEHDVISAILADQMTLEAHSISNATSDKVTQSPG